VLFPIASATAPITLAQKQRRVVVVDDDEDVGATACRILERSGARTVLVQTVREAMAELSKRTDAMVVDIGMPNGDGWSLISSIRESRDHARMPIVVMTGLLDSAEVLNRADDLGCEYLGKPFAPEALIAKIESAGRMVGGADDASLPSSQDDPKPAAVAG
jgi:two-component system, OmpR family, catabolic regulation response regulator CreB